MSRYPQRIHLSLLCLFICLFCIFSYDIYPNRRKFLVLPGQYVLTPTGPKDPVILRIQQFNVLADGMSGLRSDLGKFNKVSRDVLDFERRKHQLLREITQYDPDIITLQECDHYYDYFLPEMEKRGYYSYFAPKPTSACLEVSSNSDGCALFLKREKLSVLSIETKTLALSIAELGEGGEVQEDDKNIKAQNQVAIIAVCLLKNATEYRARNDKPVPGIIIATTHLKSSKTATGERHRALGIRQILDQVNRIYQSLEDRGKTPAVLLTGVLNAVPERTTEGYLPLTYRLVKKHNLGLRSVYNEDAPLSPDRFSSSPFYTTWKSRSEEGKERVTKRAIDYIFYSTYRNGVYKNSVDDMTQLNGEPPMTASSRGQIGISFFLRFTVYFFSTLIPITSLLSESMTRYEQIILFTIAASWLFFFEVISEGSAFRPQLAATIDTSSAAMAPPTVLPSSFAQVSSDVLSNVGTLSQKLTPLKQYGRPGFQAVRAIDVFSEEEIGKDFIPSEKYPSDHISIVADLHLLW
jgi:nocturnin